MSTWGEDDTYEPARVEVQVSMCVSFAEALGALTFAPGVILTPEELADDDDVRDSFRFAVISEGVGSGTSDRARQALAALHGRLPGPNAPSMAYMRVAAAAVTRVFGLADDPTPVPHLFSTSARRTGPFGDAA
ncbi:hypothetical protein [Actinacidiphila acidipaludis]|uniref:Uncharacterized protein n=1 Tax=Actinacidiphila acidipaludis TaxID=2873382 RepID=A0ABS7QFN5_9ACTN|nr:hypothetical protein [Streptomyces acidipaludis]MBY8881977.1 hypothetical protein [Streptomyces acidipaludis]